MRKFLLGGTAAGVVVGLLALLLVLMPAAGNDTALASGGTGGFPTIFGIDVDPDDDNDGTMDNTATSLGTIQNCIEVVSSGGTNAKPGPFFYIDVFIDDIPTGKDLAGYDHYMSYDNGACGAGACNPGPDAGWLEVNAWVGPFASGCVDWLLRSQAGSGLCGEFGDFPPDADGTLSVSCADGQLAGAELPGTLGVLNRYEMEVLQAGAKIIGLQTAGAPTYFAPSAGPRYDPDQIWDANYTPKYAIIAIDTACPVATDVKKTLLEALDMQQVALDQPLDLNVSESYDFLLHEQLHSNGPMSPILVDLTVEGTPPEGGQVSYHVTQADLDLPGDLVVTLNGSPIATNPAVDAVFVADYPDVLDVHKQVELVESDYVDLYEQWDLHCLTPSQHTWHFHNEVAPADPMIEDDVPGNNFKDIDVVVNCLAEADVKITDMTVIDLPDAKAISSPPYALPYPTLYMDIPEPVTLHKVMHNNGDYGPVDVLITKTASLSPGVGGFPPAYLGTASGYAEQCTISPQVDQVQSFPLPVSGTSPELDEVFTITCGRMGIERNDDGDSFIDEDPINAVDDDGDCVVDATHCPVQGGACTTGWPGCDEDSAFYIVNILFTNTLDLKNEHITDTSPDYNLEAQAEPAFDYEVLTLTVIREFSSTFSYVVDSSQPDQQTDPVSNSCIASPLFPCKSLSIGTIPGLGGFYGDMPLAASMTVVGTTPTHFAWMSSAPVAAPGCPLFPMAPWNGACPGITNAGKVGKIYFEVTLGVLGPCDTDVSGTAELYDMCMPPPGYAGFAGGAGNTDFVSQAGCLVDYDGSMPGPALAPGPVRSPNAIGEISWSSHLDGVVDSIQAANTGAVLWGRYAGYAVTAFASLPVNILVFDLSGWNGVGPYLSIGVTGDPAVPTPDVQTCSPYRAETLLLGQTPNNDTWNVGEMVKYCTTPNDAGHPVHPVMNVFTRLDIGEAETSYGAFTCVGAATDVWCDLDKDETPSVPVLLADDETVEVIVTNGAGPDDVAVDVSLIGPAVCDPQWLPAYGATPDPPMLIGDNQLSKISFTMDDVLARDMNANETASAFIDYEVTCPAGTYELQIIANVMPLSISDPDHLNNQCQNHPVVTAENEDVDGDTVVNWVDNCPIDANPLQEDNDEDGLGDVCDPDDDNDGIDDTADACPFSPEDDDGVDGADGCPETDLSISVDKESDIDVDVSETKRFTVTTTATNEFPPEGWGLYYPDGVRFTELLKSDVSNPDDKCEARWVCLPGDQCVNDVILEDWDNDPQTPDVPVLYSQLEVVLGPLPPDNSIDKVREYELHCNARSAHTIFLEEGIAPVRDGYVTDPDVANNVHKQFIDIEAWDNADVKILSYDVHEAPEELRLAQDGDGDSIVDCDDQDDTCATGTIVLKKVFHNNGPADVGEYEWDVYVSPDGGQDCNITFDGADVYGGLPVSDQMVAFEYYTVECNAASDHELTFGNEFVILAEHLQDPVLSNNTATVSITIPVIGATDLDLSVVVNGVDDIDVSENVLFTVDKTLSNLGSFAVTPDVVQVMSGEPDCSLSFHFTNVLLAKVDEIELSCDGVVIDPPTPAGWEGSDTVFCAPGEEIAIAYQASLAAHEDLVLEEEFDKHCLDVCDHYFSLDTSVSRDAARDPHVEFATVTDTQNWMEEVWADADLKILDWFFLDLPEIATDVYKVLVPPLSNAYGHQKEVIHNNGPFGPVDLFKTISATPTDGCSVSYECVGGEMIMLNDWIVIWDCPAGYDTSASYPVDYGDHMDVQFYVEDLAVSVNHWQSELWGFQIDEHVWECTVDFEKTLEGATGHVITQDATDSKAVVVCADTDEDGVPDNCMGEVDNCPLVPNPDQTDSDGDGVGDACEVDRGVEIKYCLKFGPAPVNISDHQGRYLWTICEIGNTGSMDEAVTVSLDVSGAPACDPVMTQQLILPGQDTFPLMVEEQKFVLWRNRFECHEPAEVGIHALTVTACIDAAEGSVDHDNDQSFGEDPIDGQDNDGDSLVDEDPPDTPPTDCHEQIRNLIVHDPS